MTSKSVWDALQTQTVTAQVFLPNLTGDRVSALCPAGKRVLGGGHFIGDDVELHESHPNSDGTGWEVQAFNKSILIGGGSNTLRAYAICAASS